NTRKRIATMPRSGSERATRYESRKSELPTSVPSSALEVGTSHSMTDIGEPLARTSSVRSSLFAALLQRNHELQPGPGIVDRTDLDVHQPKRQCGIADDIFSDIGTNAGGLFRP